MNPVKNNNIDIDEFIKLLHNSSTIKLLAKSSYMYGDLMETLILPVKSTTLIVPRIVNKSTQIKLANCLPIKYHKHNYGITNIRIYTTGTFNLQLLLNSNILDIMDSHYLLPSDTKDGSTYCIKLTEHLIFIYSLIKLYGLDIIIQTDDPDAKILIDIVKHTYRHMPKKSLVCKSDLQNRSSSIYLNTICNIIYIWVADASYVTMVFSHLNIYTKQDLIQHTVQDLWYYEFNDPKSSNIDKSIRLNRCDVVIDTDGKINRIRADGYNILLYVYEGNGKGKTGQRAAGLMLG